MWTERQRHGFSPARVRDVRHAAENRLVPSMHAVEIAQCQNRRDESPRARGDVTEDLHLRAECLELLPSLSRLRRGRRRVTNTLPRGDGRLASCMPRARERGDAHMSRWLGRMVALLSGRCSSEIALKAIRAGIPILAGVSAPTSMALQLAEAFNLTLVGFARDNRFNVYCHRGRLTSRHGRAVGGQP